MRMSNEYHHPSNIFSHKNRKAVKIGCSKIAILYPILSKIVHFIAFSQALDIIEHLSKQIKKALMKKYPMCKIIKTNTAVFLIVEYRRMLLISEGKSQPNNRTLSMPASILLH